MFEKNIRKEWENKLIRNWAYKSESPSSSRTIKTWSWKTKKLTTVRIGYRSAS